MKQPRFHMDAKFLKCVSRLIIERKMSVTNAARMLNCERALIIEALAKPIVDEFIARHKVQP